MWNKACWVLVGLLLASLLSLNYYKDKADLNAHNYSAAMDSLRHIQLKNGEMAAEKSMYILEKKDLESALNMSKSEIKDLEKKLGKISAISKVTTTIEYDSIYVRDTVRIVDNTQQFDINHNDEWISIHGHSIIKDNIASTTFENIAVPVPLQVGMTDDYKIWVKSQNPYLNITDIRGAIVNGSQFAQKPKRWGIGIQGGIGLQYGLIRKQVDVGPYIGVGISYNLLRF